MKKREREKEIITRIHSYPCWWRTLKSQSGVLSIDSSVDRIRYHWNKQAGTAMNIQTSIVFDRYPDQG